MKYIYLVRFCLNCDWKGKLLGLLEEELCVRGQFSSIMISLKEYIVI